MTVHRPDPQRRTRQLGQLLLGVCLLASGPAWGADPTEESRFYPGLYYPGVADSSQAEAISLRPGEFFSEINLALDPSGGSIAGKVLGEAQPQPIPLAGVLVTAGNAGRRVMTRSGADGSFVLAGVPAGDVLVRYATDDPLSREVHYLARYYPGASDPTAATTVTVRNGETAALDQVVLPVGSSFGGVVLAQDTGLPMGRIPVRVEARLPGSGSWTTHTSPQGRFLYGGLPGGSYLVQALPEESEYISAYYGGGRDPEQAATLNLVPGQSVPDLEIRLPRGGMIWGEIRRETGVGYVDLVVQATNFATGTVYTGVTYGFGQYRIIGLPAGDYRIYVPLLRKYYDRTDDGTYDRSRAQRVSVAEAEDVFHINLMGGPADGCRLPPGFQGAITGRIRGDFTDADRIVVRVYSATDTVDQEIELTGYYTVGCLPAGQCKVALLTNGPVVAEFFPRKRQLRDAQAVLIAQGDTASGIDFNPERGVRLSGHVSDRQNGQPLSRTRIHALEMDTRIAVTCEADSLGNFVLDRIRLDPTSPIESGLPAGRWRVAAESTFVPAPSFTPVLQPRLRADSGESGQVSLNCWLSQGTRWCYLLARFDAGTVSADPGGDVLEEQVVARGETTPADPEDILSIVDRPPGTGPYQYLLLAWPSTRTCGDPPAGSVFRAVSDAVSPDPQNPLSLDDSLPPSVLVYPSPWTGQGNLRFLAGRPLRQDGQLKIFTAAGRAVASAEWPRGQKELTWQLDKAVPRALPSGICFWSLRERGVLRVRGSFLLIH